MLTEAADISADHRNLVYSGHSEDVGNRVAVLVPVALIITKPVRNMATSRCKLAQVSKAGHGRTKCTSPSNAKEQTDEGPVCGQAGPDE